VSNVKVWNSETGDCVFALYVKTFSKTAWPYVRFTTNETYALTMTTNEIKVYKPSAGFDRFIKKIRLLDVSSFSIAPASVDSDLSDDPAAVFHTFVPEKKGKPARVSIFRYPDAMDEANPLVAKSFFQAEEVNVKWSPRGDAALVLAQTTVDRTGESYYGSTHLHWMSTAPGNKEAVQVPLEKQGPVSAVEWCPMTKHNLNQPPLFCVISGKMPALGALYNGQTCQPTFLLGESHKNTLSWSPSGRFLCVAGFGNLAGRMEFWDRNKCKPIPQIHLTNDLIANGGEADVTYGNTSQAAGCSFGWSPDSRMFHVSTTSPRMNVDNGIRLYRYSGLGPICDFSDNLQPDQLLSADFLPPRQDIEYPDRPQSPVPKGLKLKVPDALSANSRGSSKLVPASIAATMIAPPVQAYVPPSARARLAETSGGVGGGISLAERMRRDMESKTVLAQKVTKVPTSTFKVPGGTKTIPGMAPAQASAKQIKNAIKRDKAKLKKAQEEEEALLKTKAEEQALEIARAEEDEKEIPREETPMPDVDPQKRLRKVRKLLKQVEALRLKDISELDDDQRKKLHGEPLLLEELHRLENEIGTQ